MKDIKNKILIIVRSLLVFLIFFYSFLWQYIPVLLFNINKLSLTNNIKIAVLLSTLSDVITLLILLLIYYKDLVKDFKTFKNNLSHNIKVALSHWTIGIIIMLISNYILFILFKENISDNEQLVRTYINSFPLIMGINVCLIAPIVEELVFRKSLKDVFKNPIVFSIISFLLFGGAHIINTISSPYELLYIIPYGIMGLVFALADYKTDTVFTSIFAHILHNSLTMILIILL